MVTRNSVSFAIFFRKNVFFIVKLRKIQISCETSKNSHFLRKLEKSKFFVKIRKIHQFLWKLKNSPRPICLPWFYCSHRCDWPDHLRWVQRLNVVLDGLHCAIHRCAHGAPDEFPLRLPSHWLISPFFLYYRNRRKQCWKKNITY